jgi:hypothetical protein
LDRDLVGRTGSPRVSVEVVMRLRRRTPLPQHSELRGNIFGSPEMQQEKALLRPNIANIYENWYFVPIDRVSLRSGGETTTFEGVAVPSHRLMRPLVRAFCPRNSRPTLVRYANDSKG